VRARAARAHERAGRSTVRLRSHTPHGGPSRPARCTPRRARQCVRDRATDRRRRGERERGRGRFAAGERERGRGEARRGGCGDRDRDVLRELSRPIPVPFARPIRCSWARADGAAQIPLTLAGKHIIFASPL